MKRTFRDLLADNKPILFDGAMGTQLYDKGLFLNMSFDNACLTQPELVRQIHEAYVAAGADVIETNTFGANRVRLKNFALEAKTEEINREAARLAREAAGERILVAGAVGPLGIKIEPYGPTSYEEARAYYREQAQGLIDGGVDLFVLETFSRIAELEQAVLAIRDLTEAPIVGMLTVNDFGQTLFGAEPLYLLPEVERLPIDALGINCSVGPKVIYDVMESLAPHARLPLVAMPNAGLPRDVDGRNMYLCTPEYMATYAKRLIKLGVKGIGGCCGTTPDHIRAIARAIGQSMVSSVKKKGTAPPGAQ